MTNLLSSAVVYIIPSGEGCLSRLYTPTKVTSNGFQVPIKIYKDGKFTKKMVEWTTGTKVEWRKTNDKDHSAWLKEASHGLLVAAGTGIAPFVRILEEFLADDDCALRIKLVYCVKKMEDVLFMETLKKWTKHWNFQLVFVLSDKDYDASSVPHLASVQSGRRLCQEIFAQEFSSFASSFSSSTKVAVCGSKSFEKDVINFATRGRNDLSTNQVFRFPG